MLSYLTTEKEPTGQVFRAWQRLKYRSQSVVPHDGENTYR